MTMRLYNDMGMMTAAVILTALLVSRGLAMPPPAMKHDGVVERQVVLSNPTPVKAAQFPHPLLGSYRKDFYLPYDIYPEAHLPSPVHGGRVHVVTMIQAQLPFQSVQVNGVEALNLTSSGESSDDSHNRAHAAGRDSHVSPQHVRGLEDPDLTYFDWAKVFYETSTAQFSLAFHSRNSDWLDTPSPVLNITVVDAAGTAWTGEFAPRLSNLTVTWATSLSPNGDEWVVHVHNFDAVKAFTISQLWFDGLPAYNISVPLPVTLGPGQHLVTTLMPPGAASKQQGNLFTLTVLANSSDNQPVAVAYGMRAPEHRFPVEVWPSSVDCPVPTANDKHYAELQSHNIDTVFYSAGNFEAKCNQSFVETANAISVSHPEFYFWTDPTSLSGLNDTALEHVSAVFLADENDGHLDHNLRDTLKAALDVAHQYPRLLTYQGGKTNRYDGAYAGICDIQGLDFYIAGCAPTIVPVTSTLPIQASYAYIRNARNNQMPLSSMLYSQLYGGWSVEPNANELAVELIYPVIAGAKGITLFQSVQKDFDKKRSDWDGLVKDIFLSITQPTVREVLRTGDIDGLPFTWSDPGDPIKSIKSLVQVIRNHQYLLIVAVNTDADGYNNLFCHIDVSDHWHFSDHTISSVDVSLQSGVSVTQADLSNAREVIGGQLVSVQHATISLESATQLRAANVELKADEPVRMFLIPYQLA